MINQWIGLYVTMYVAVAVAVVQLKVANVSAPYSIPIIFLQ